VAGSAGASGNAGAGSGAGGTAGESAGGTGNTGGAGASGASGTSAAGAGGAGSSGASGTSAAGAGGAGSSGASGTSAGGSASGASGASGTGGASYLFYDAFETSADLNVFTNGGSTATHEIVAGGAFTGSAHHLLIRGSDGGFAGLHYVFATPIQPSAVSYWIRLQATPPVVGAEFDLSNTSKADLVLAWSLLTWISGNTPPQTYEAAGDMSNTVMESSDNGSELATNVWYHIELDFTWASGGGSFVAKLDDTPVGAALTFSEASIARLDVFSIGGTIEIDDIAISP
jgi:hypothetical protein